MPGLHIPGLPDDISGPVRADYRYPAGLTETQVRDSAPLRGYSGKGLLTDSSGMERPIHIKPHHFVDIITAYGGGVETFRPHPYGHALHAVAERILTQPDLLLELVLGADDICAPCVHNIDGICDDTIDTSYRPTAPPAKHEWNLLIDRRWCRRLGLEPGRRISARELCRLLARDAQDLCDIYPEIPTERTAERARKLQAGIRRFLDQGQ